jgi:hypothetical protein
MRDLIFILIVGPLLLVCFFRPFLGILLWTVIAKIVPASNSTARSLCSRQAQRNMGITDIILFSRNGKGRPGPISDASEAVRPVTMLEEEDL